MANNNRRNRLEVPGAENLMNKFKLEVAEELGIQNYDQLDKGSLPARVHGKIGGNMVRKMIQYAEAAMAQDPNVLTSIEATPGVNQDDIDTVQAYMNNGAFAQAGQETAQGGAAVEGNITH